MNDGTNIETIAEVPKGTTSFFRVSIGDYRGWCFVYLQLFRKAEGETGESEMRAGLTMRSDTLADLLPVLGLALEKAEARNSGKRRGR